MKNTNTRNHARILAGSLVAFLLGTALPQSAQAGLYYWDVNGNTAGFGTPASGTWGTDANWSTDDSGAATITAYTTTTSDGINFGAGVTGLGAGTVAVTGTQNAGTLTFASGSGAITLSDSGGAAINLPAASTITLNNAADTITTPLTGAATSLTKDGTGTLTLSGANTYTGTTIIKAGTLQIGDGGGSLYGTTGTDLTFNGTGTFNVKEAASSTQGMGTLTFSAGEGNVYSTGIAAQNSTLTFASMAARSAGATANFNILTNTTAGQNMIKLTSTANAPLATGGTAPNDSNNPGIFFDLNNATSTGKYARYDSTNGFRATIYGASADSNAPAAIGTSTTGMGVNDAAKDVSITGAITNQDTASVNTILYNNSITLKANAVLSVNGVLLSGTAGKFVGPNTVTCYVQPTSSGGEIVLGSQATAYTVQIVMGAIVQNNGSSPTRVTKAGLGNGVLQRLNTYTGVTTINGGLLRVLKWDNGGNPSGLGQSSKAAENLVINGGALCYGNVNPTLHVTTDRLFTIGAAGARLDCSSTGGNPVSNWDIGGGGSIAFSSSSAPASLTLANDTGPSGIGTLSAVLGDSGTGANVTSVTKTGLGTWQLAAANTYTGNTTILTGGTLTLTSTGTLKFAPGANDICNKVTGGGTANFNGTFNIDTTNADTTTGNAWTLVDVTNKTYSLINITDFTNSSGVWTKVDGTKTWTFDQSTGKLSLVNSGGTTYTVTFNNNGGSGTMTAMTGSSAAALTSNTFTRTGYTFTGWNTASNGLGTPYADGASYAFTANATMYAQWTANTYTVTFDGNGGETPSPTSMSVTYDSTYGTLATVTRALYTFNGWFTAASGGTLVTSASTVAITDAQTLYAQWTLTPITYTVTFDNNTGSGTMTAQTGSSAANLTNNTFTKTGYIFAGWNTLADNTGTAYADGASYAFTASTTLYAQWTAVPTSTGATLAALENTATALAESDFGYANTANPASVLAAVQIIELPALGTLTYISTATPVAKDDIILAAYIGNLSYLSPLGGFGSPYTTIGIKVQNSDTPTGLWSLPAIMTVNVTHVNHAPTSTGGSVILRENTVKTFASTDFQFSDADSGDALSAIKVVTSLPAGTLNLGLTPVGLGDVIPVASIGTLTYTPALNYTGPDSFNFQVSDGIAFSANATMAITVTPDILVSNGSFETPGTSASGPWATFGSPWVLTNPPAGSLPYQQLKAVDGGAFTSAPDGLWVGLINEDDCPITAPLTQNLGVSVADGDTLTVTFQSGRQLNAVGGTGVAYFDVDGTKYTTPFDTTTLTAGAWQLTTMTHAITNSGNLTLGFYGTTGHTINAWIDNISNVSVSTGPPAVTYAAWASTNGAGTQTMEQDHDNDGVSNGVEYFLGGNTNTTGFTALPGVVNTAGTLSVTWIKAADYTGVYGAASDYVVQTSTTLATGDWTDEPETGGDVTVTGTDVTYTFPSVGPVKFARLKVMGTP